MFRFVSVQDNDVEVDVTEAGSKDRIWMDMAFMSAICKVQVLQPVLQCGQLSEFWFVCLNNRIIVTRRFNYFNCGI